MFDDLGTGSEAVAGASPPQQLADTMHGAWVAFATRGDPGWARYDLTRPAAMRFDTTSEVVHDPLDRPPRSAPERGRCMTTFSA